MSKICAALLVCMLVLVYGPGRAVAQSVGEPTPWWVYQDLSELKFQLKSASKCEFEPKIKPEPVSSFKASRGVSLHEVAHKKGETWVEHFAAQRQLEREHPIPTAKRSDIVPDHVQCEMPSSVGYSSSQKEVLDELATADFRRYFPGYANDQRRGFDMLSMALGLRCGLAVGGGVEVLLQAQGHRDVVTGNYYTGGIKGYAAAATVKALGLSFGVGARVTQGPWSFMAIGGMQWYRRPNVRAETVRPNSIGSLDFGAFVNEHMEVDASVIRWYAEVEAIWRSKPLFFGMKAAFWYYDLEARLRSDNSGHAFLGASNYADPEKRIGDGLSKNRLLMRVAPEIGVCRPVVGCVGFNLHMGWGGLWSAELTHTVSLW